MKTYQLSRWKIPLQVVASLFSLAIYPQIMLGIWKDITAVIGWIFSLVIKHFRSLVYSMCHYRPPTKLREDHVLSCLSVIMSAQGGGIPMWLLPMMHQTWPYKDPLVPLPRTGTPDMFKPVQLGPHCTPSPRHVQIYSLWSTYGWQVGGWHPTGMPSWKRSLG